MQGPYVSAEHLHGTIRSSTQQAAKQALHVVLCIATLLNQLNSSQSGPLAKAGNRCCESGQYPVPLNPSFPQQQPAI
jgi:hypothetical protein